jgi:hypothetical protein
MEYITVSDVDAYAADFGQAWSGTLEEKEAAIRRAEAYLNGLHWKGRRTGGREQVPAWPRAGVTDGDGFEIDADEVPHEVETAASVLAVVEIANPGFLTPQVTLSHIATSETVGPLSVSYRTATGASDVRPVITAAMDAIKPLLKGRTVFLERA